VRSISSALLVLLYYKQNGGGCGKVTNSAADIVAVETTNAVISVYQQHS